MRKKSTGTHNEGAVGSQSIFAEMEQQALFSLHPSPTTGRRALAFYS